MKLRLLFLAVFFYSFLVSAQDYKWSIEANYPLTVGDNFIEQYDGIIDLGLKYRFTDIGFVKVGASLNGTLLTDNPSQNNDDDFSRTAITLQPKIFGELKIPAIEKLRPSIGLGYSMFFFNATGEINNIDISSNDSTQSGFSYNLGLSYDITSMLFIQAQYDFTKLSKDDDVISIDYNRNVSIFKFGAGIRF